MLEKDSTVKNAQGVAQTFQEWSKIIRADFKR